MATATKNRTNKGQVDFDVLTVRGLRVLDDNGVERISLGIHADGTAEVEVRAVGYETGKPNDAGVHVYGNSEQAAGIMVMAEGGFSAPMVDIEADGVFTHPNGPDGRRPRPDSERIAALEAEVEELRSFVPMLARMAFYERLRIKSIPEHIDDIGETFAVLAAVLHEHSTMNGCALPDGYEAIPIAEPLRRPADEDLPVPAQDVAGQMDEMERILIASQRSH